jgi:hypothetical protein
MFDRSLHKELWMWLSENPECDKNEWPQWKHNGGTIDNVGSLCFACFSCVECRDCPLVWIERTGSGYCHSFRSPYNSWIGTEVSSERSRLAKEIAELPVKDGVEYI